MPSTPPAIGGGSGQFSFDDFLAGATGGGGGGMSFTQMGLATGNPYAAAAGAAADVALKFMDKIGAGRKEADRIVPAQNEYHQTILAPASAAADDPNTPLKELQVWRKAVADSGAAFQKFIQDPSFKDGRASTQAYETIFGNPGYGRLVLEHLDSEIVKKGGSAGGGTLLELAGIGGGGSLPLIAIGIVAFLFLRK